MYMQVTMKRVRKLIMTLTERDRVFLRECKTTQLFLMNKSSKYFDYLIKVSKRMMDKKYKDRITEVVQRLEQNGGKVSD